MYQRSKESKKSYSYQCQDPACPAQASFGYEHDRKMIRCAKHQIAGMTNLRRKICEHPTCSTTASFGRPLTKVSKHYNAYSCLALVSLRANMSADSATAVAFAPTSQERRFCGKHKEDGMVNLTESYRCKHNGCSTTACYGREGDKASVHLTLTMCYLGHLSQQSNSRELPFLLLVILSSCHIRNLSSALSTRKLRW
jgi:EsV-1-7 cysteine-rich motif